jgi:hypothetical protein
MSLYSQ